MGSFPHSKREMNDTLLYLIPLSIEISLYDMGPVIQDHEGTYTEKNPKADKKNDKNLSLP